MSKFCALTDDAFYTKIQSHKPCDILRKNYSKKSDAWSIGVLLYYLFTQKLPFSSNKMDHLFNLIASGKYNPKPLDDNRVSKEGKDLVKSLLVVDENERISIEECLNSPWIKKFSVQQNNQAIVKFLESNNIIENFRNFDKYSNFKKEILFYIAKISNDDEIIQLKKIFMEFDKDNTGTIEKEEVQQIFFKLQISTDDVNV